MEAGEIGGRGRPSIRPTRREQGSCPRCMSQNGAVPECHGGRRPSRVASPGGRVDASGGPNWDVRLEAPRSRGRRVEGERIVGDLDQSPPVLDLRPDGLRRRGLRLGMAPQDAVRSLPTSVSLASLRRTSGQQPRSSPGCRTEPCNRWSPNGHPEGSAPANGHESQPRDAQASCVGLRPAACDFRSFPPHQNAASGRRRRPTRSPTSVSQTAQHSSRRDIARQTEKADQLSTENDDSLRWPDARHAGPGRGRRQRDHRRVRAARARPTVGLRRPHQLEMLGPVLRRMGQLSGRRRALADVRHTGAAGRSQAQAVDQADVSTPRACIRASTTPSAPGVRPTRRAISRRVRPSLRNDTISRSRSRVLARSRGT